MKKLLLSLMIISTLFACRDNGGNGDGASGYTHNELAQEFVSSLNLDPEFSVSLVKSSTLKNNFIVIYDPYTDTYDAININNYDPAINNATDYYFDNSSANYFNLAYIPGYWAYDYQWTVVGYDYYGYAIYGYEYYDYWVPTRYQDIYSGMTFEKTASNPKDLAKVAALAEVATITKKAEYLSKELGLSLSRGKEVARLAANWKKSSLKGMTNAEQDSFATELLGFSITAGKKAVVSGDLQSLDQLIENAAKVNAITPEHASKLIGKFLSL
ncbi:MAG: hypothetical protein HON90_06435 [Halobacteriovoraceae bacterium]|jgi:hypothetical protein|nr:hypothetical protein [Halobacteriovoraceae bacterium]